MQKGGQRGKHSVNPSLSRIYISYRDIAEISEAVGENVGVFVARGDGPSNRISREVMRREGWFSEKGRE